MEQYCLFDRPLGSYTRAQLALLAPNDIYATADDKLLLGLKEDRRLERKPARIHAGELGEYFSMWANTIPDGGLIVIGQEDDGTFFWMLQSRAKAAQ